MLKKDLLIEITRDAIASLKSSRDTLALCYDLKRITADNKRNILATLRRLSNSIESIEAALAMSECKKLGNMVKEIKEAYLDYKRIHHGT